MRKRERLKSEEEAFNKKIEQFDALPHPEQEKWLQLALAELSPVLRGSKKPPGAWQLNYAIRDFEMWRKLLMNRRYTIDRAGPGHFSADTIAYAASKGVLLAEQIVRTLEWHVSEKVDDLRDYEKSRRVQGRHAQQSISESQDQRPLLKLAIRCSTMLVPIISHLPGSLRQVLFRLSIS